MPEKGWLHCKIMKGMFSDERIIKILRTGMTFFVHRDQVQGDIDRDGKVRVYLLKRDNCFWAILPTEDVTIIQVESDELELAEAV